MTEQTRPEPSTSPIRLKAEDVLFFNRQLASMARLNMPIAKGLRVLARDVSDSAFRQLIEAVQQDLDEGRSLQEALARHPESFSPLHLEIVKAGEATGNLAVILDELNAHTESIQRVKARILESVLYPAVISAAILMFVAFFLLFVAPPFEEMLAKRDILSTAAAVDPPEVERPVDLGLGRIWLRPGLPDRRKKPEWSSGAQSAGGLGQALEARDQERGLGRGGVVATLARSAALGAGPQEGEATFLVMADRDGRVTSVSLSEDRGGWSAVTRALERSLAGKRLRVPPGANGLSVAVRVQAKVQLPSGSSPKRPVRGAGAGAEFDVADIGATPTRVVSARVTSERVL